MVTPDQLAAIKARYSTSEPLDYGVMLRMHGDLLIVLADYERLTRHNQRMATALAQLSDKENWLQAIGLVALSEDNEIAGIGSDAEFTYIWMASNNPQQLAERALVEDN